MFKLLSIALIVLASQAPAFGIEPERYTIRFSVYGLRPGDYANLYFRDATGGPHDVAFKPKRRSIAYDATLTAKDPVLRFYRRPNPNTEENELLDSPPLATVPLPPASGRQLIVFQRSRGSQTDEQYSVFVADDAEANFPAGSIRVLNTTGAEISSALNGNRFQLKQGQISRPTHVGNSDARITVVARGADRYHLLYRNEFEFDDKGRALLILRPPAREGSLRVGGHLLYEGLEVTD